MTPTPLNSNLVPPQASALNPKVIGLNAELSTVALPLAPGKRVKIYLGGEGVDQVPGTSISRQLALLHCRSRNVSRANKSQRRFRLSASSAGSGRMRPLAITRLRLQSNSGETAYVPGAITIDPGVASTVSNPVDDFRFFITQQYADLDWPRA